MQRIEQRLRQGMGLDAETIGSSSLQRIVRLRMKAVGARTVEDYERMLNTSAAEWNQLVEAVVITETWFFRDRQAFSALVNMMLQEWLPGRPTARANILSLPCSSGEEPYSVAMALLDAGIGAGKFTIDGVDLSQHALAKAAAGVYGKNSFRGSELSYRERHFEAATQGFILKQSVRDCVKFQQANLLSDTFNLGVARYDFIFCRNLLIYFDRETQQRAFAKLESLLARGGTLFVGPAEVPLALENGFSAITLPMAFACRRSVDSVPPKRVATPSRPTRSVTRAMVVPTPASAPPEKVKPKPAVQAVTEELSAARELADSGKLDEATRVCHAHLHRHGASVQAYYLLGVIHDAQGNPVAQDFYRKALYLDPNHYESLLQMALLAEKNGDSVTARNLRRRAQRQQIA